MNRNPNADLTSIVSEEFPEAAHVNRSEVCDAFEVWGTMHGGECRISLLVPIRLLAHEDATRLLVRAFAEMVREYP